MRIAKLLPSEKIPGRWLIWLDDGALVRVSENEVAAFSLYAGMELPDETYEALAAAAQVSEMKEKALSLLAGRPMSRRELVDRLSAERGNRAAAPRLETAEAVADRLEELGYLDDAAYARTVAREKDFKLYELDITAQDFIDNIGNVIYALDAPVAGPGSFSQYMISRLAAHNRSL